MYMYVVCLCACVCACMCIWYMLVCTYMCVCKLEELNFETTFAKVSHLVLSKACYQPGPWSWWKNSITAFFFFCKPREVI